MIPFFTWGMTLSRIIMALMYANRDGQITLDEIKEIATEFVPAFVTDIIDEAQEALEDGKISVDEALDIIELVVRIRKR